MNYASNKEQILIYLGKFKRNFLNSNGWYSFISTAIIAIITCIVAGKDGFSTGLGAEVKSTSFIIVCACIWIGVFNSITLICKERDIIKHEYRGGMNLSSYMFAHMLFQALVSLIQAIIFSSILFLFYHHSISEFKTILDNDSLRFISYFLTIFLTIYSADALGLFVSSIVKNVEKAMTVMPFVILLQFLFAGNIPLNDFLQFLSYFTLSRYSFDGLLDLAGFKEGGSFFSTSTKVQVNLIVAWILLVAFSILLAYLASKLLKSVEKDTRG